MVEEFDSDDGNAEVWSTDSEDEKVHKPTHGICFIHNKLNTGANEAKCLMVKSVDSYDQGSESELGDNSDDAKSFASCYSTKNVDEYMESCNKVTEKVHSILKFLNVPIFKYNDELTELQENISELGGILKYNRIKVSNLNDHLSRSNFKSEERRLNIEELDFELRKTKVDVCILSSDNNF